MADRYWVGGTNTWDGTLTGKWATTSGGAAGAAVPTLSDNVFFDAASGAVTVTVSSARPCLACNFTGFTGTLTGASTPVINFYGDVTLSTGMTSNIVSGPAWTIGGATSRNFTSNGKQIRGFNVTTAGATVVLQDAFYSVGALTITNGTFNANNHNVTCVNMSASGSLARGITMGSGTWTMTGTAAVWACSSATALSFNAGTSTLVIADTSSTQKNLSTTATGNMTFYNVTIAGSAGNVTFFNGAMTISGTLTLQSGWRAFIPNNLGLTIGTLVAADGVGPGNYTYIGAPNQAAPIVLTNDATMNKAVVQGVSLTGTGSITVRDGVNVNGNTGNIFFIGGHAPQATYGVGI